MVNQVMLDIRIIPERVIADKIFKPSPKSGQLFGIKNYTKWL